MSRRPDSPAARAVERYLDHLLLERGLAARTVEAYRRDLDRLADDLVEHGSDLLTFDRSLRRRLTRSSGEPGATATLRWSAAEPVTRMLRRHAAGLLLASLVAALVVTAIAGAGGALRAASAPWPLPETPAKPVICPAFSSSEIPASGVWLPTGFVCTRSSASSV